MCSLMIHHHHQSGIHSDASPFYTVRHLNENGTEIKFRSYHSETEINHRKNNKCYRMRPIV